MVIKKITLHNFGVYAGTNSLYFSATKPVVLIGGMNGRGKTTILNAVLIALYGANSFTYKDSSYQSYGSYLSSFVNENDGSLSSYIELEMTMDKSDDCYSIRRSWNKNGTYVKEMVSVKKNHCYDEFLANNWSLFIEGLIPSALSQYFFFDGDNIAELATGSIDEKMKKSIKSLLGISNLDQLEKDLKRVRRKAEKEIDNTNSKEESEELRKLMENAKQDLEMIDEELKELDEKKAEAEKQLEKKKLDYIAKGGLIVEKRQQLINERTELNAFLMQRDSELIESAASNLPLCLVADYLKKIEKKIKNEQESTNLQNAYKTINYIYNAMNFKDDEKEVIGKFITRIRSMAEQSKADMTFNASEQMLIQLKNLITNDFDEKRRNVRGIIKEKKQLAERIANIDEQLSIDIDEKQIAKIYADIKRKEGEIIDINEHIVRINKKRSEANGVYIKANSKFSKAVEAYLSELDVRDESERVLTYTDKAEKVLNEYRVRLQKRKIESLAETITDCYKRIRNKENLINRIKMDPNTLDFIYLNSVGKEVSKSSLSQGEKQMMIISILWALAISSKRKLPVIIDTPLARLDSAHRLSLIKKYFPNASDQTIILSTDSEIVGEYYDVLKDNISDEYTLIYNDEKKCSQVVKGYFGEKQ